MFNAAPVTEKPAPFSVAHLARPQLADGVWPENWPAFSLFARLETQWRITPSGQPSGLDYAAVYPLIDRMHLAAPAWQQMFDDIRVMELAAINDALNNRP